MKQYRLNRLFNPESKRCFDVAMDHGVFNEPAFLSGLENMRRAVQTVVAANPDAVQLAATAYSPVTGSVTIHRATASLPSTLSSSELVPTGAALLEANQNPETWENPASVLSTMYS